MSRKHKVSKPAQSVSHHRQHQKRCKRNLSWLWIGMGALFIVLVGILLLNQKTKQSFEITPSQAFVKFQQGSFILDVRNRDEWDQFHIEGSTLIPLDQLQNRLSEIPGNRDIVVVCRSGRRSQSGVTILQQAGFSRISTLHGGLLAWTAAGYPVQTNTP
jgi:rhodanese-related sulfurtransferase